MNSQLDDLLDKVEKLASDEDDFKKEKEKKKPDEKSEKPDTKAEIKPKLDPRDKCNKFS